MQKILIYILPLMAIALLSGCGDQMDPLVEQTEQNRLVIRLFSSMQERNYETSLVCLEKIRSLNPRENFIPELAERLKANSEVATAQITLDSGEAVRAATSLSRSVSRYPFNKSIANQRAKAEKLAKIEKTVQKYTAESDPAAKLKLLDEITKLAGEFKVSAAFKQSIAQARDKLTAEIKANAEREAKLKAEAEQKIAEAAQAGSSEAKNTSAAPDGQPEKSGE